MTTTAVLDRRTHFICESCGELRLKKNGLAIRMNFTTIDKPVVTRKSRTIGLWCLDCLEGKHDAYNMPVGQRRKDSEAKTRGE